jgi:hypothetical protein
LTAVDGDDGIATCRIWGRRQVLAGVALDVPPPDAGLFDKKF